MPDLKGEIDYSTVRAGDFSTLHFQSWIEHQFNTESSKDHSWITKPLGEIHWKIKYMISEK